MKNSTSRLLILLIVAVQIFFSVERLSAQCNFNDRYDKIISGYHSSIALKSNGTYSVWGAFMSSTGASDVLAPQDINNTNYPPILLSGVLKAALGGNTSGSRVDQGIILTTTGLWAWGVEGIVVNTSLTTSSAFQKFSPAGSNSYGLPTGVNPSDVANLSATYQTLILLTTSGNVWILTQTTLAVEGNGGTVTTAGTSTWKQVKINSTTTLTNVTAVRGQVSSATYNAFIALTTTGEVYTWGNSSYLGNSTVSAARNYATLMTIPIEFSGSVIPKIVGVTGGISTTASTKNTYYLLSNAGNLYSLGDNTQRQCGDFTTTERTGWVNVKINSTTNFNNIDFFSCQEHNSSFPGVAAITKNGVLYTWGNNSSSMLGRTDDGTPSGVVAATYDPGIPVGFIMGTDKAVLAELGGHTLVYLKEGNSQFCYVGHRTNGSVGDGTATASSNGAFFASCALTPSLNICGSVPVAASAVNSTIIASQPTIAANGITSSLITIRLKDASNVNLLSSGGIIAVTTTAGTIGSVTDNNDGTYTVVLTSSVTPAVAVISYTINGTSAVNTASVVFSSVLPLTWGNMLVYRRNKEIIIEWNTLQELNVSHFDIQRCLNGDRWTPVISDIPAKNSRDGSRYIQMDKDFNAARLFYRIKQYDLDGHYTYSPVRIVPADESSDRIIVYPVPVHKSFQIANVIPAEVKQTDLYTINGIRIKSWKIFQPVFDMQGISPGIYILKVQMTNGDQQKIKLNKL